MVLILKKYNFRLLASTNCGILCVVKVEGDLAFIGNFVSRGS